MNEYEYEVNNMEEWMKWILITWINERMKLMNMNKLNEYLWRTILNRVCQINVRKKNLKLKNVNSGFLKFVKNE